MPAQPPPTTEISVPECRSPDQNDEITNETSQRCQLCGQSLNRKSKIMIIMSTIALIIVGVFIITGLAGPMSKWDWTITNYQCPWDWLYYEEPDENDPLYQSYVAEGKC